MISVGREERSGRNLSFVADKREQTSWAAPLLWTVPVQYTAASLSCIHTRTCRLKNRRDCGTSVLESRRQEKWPVANWIVSGGHGSFCPNQNFLFFNGWQKYLGKLGRAAWCGWCLSNPANRIRREDRRGRLAAVYNAGMDLKRSKGLQKALWRRWCSLGWSAGVYILPAWTYGLALQINIQRHLILPSVRWQIEGRVMWIKDGRDIEIKREAFIKMPLF